MTWRRWRLSTLTWHFDLLATGRAVWQVLAGAMSAQGTVGVSAGQVLYADAPLGVGYFVAVLDSPDREPVPVPRA